MKESLEKPIRTISVQEDFGTVFCSCKNGIHYIPVNKGRFKSKALTDDAAVLACMAYVDLNPIRANIAKTPESSNNTSIQEHVIAYKKENKQKLSKPLKKVLKANPQSGNHNPKYLKLFAGLKENEQINDNPLPIERESYLELVDATGKAIKAGKRGHIPQHLQPILTRLNIEPKEWTNTVSNFKSSFGHLVGSITIIDEWREKKNETDNSDIKWIKGQKQARKFYRT